MGSSDIKIPADPAVELPDLRSACGDHRPFRPRRCPHSGGARQARLRRGPLVHAPGGAARVGRVRLRASATRGCAHGGSRAIGRDGDFQWANDSELHRPPRRSGSPSQQVINRFLRRQEGIGTTMPRILARPETCVIHPLFFQAWARR
jgi:hypothetical protein